MVTEKSKKATTAQLVAQYNEAASTLGEKPVKKLGDRKTAERLVRDIESQVRPKKSRGLHFELVPSKDKSAPRENSMRAKHLAEL